jgi:nicotinate-nucleotide--dimethylbenzimidazole phosphoribosyltransferase
LTPLSSCPSFPSVARLDDRIAAEARRLVDEKAKPPGSLGRIEDLAVRLAGILGTPAPRLDRATLLLFAGDHGLVEAGVSRYPSAVTAARVSTLLAGRASANAFAAAVGADVVVVDAGVAVGLPIGDGLRHEKVRFGTANAAREPAMTRDEAETALSMGARLARDAVASGADAILLGEMGIGNTASAALLTHRLAPAALEACVGPGAGQDEAGLAQKLSVLRTAASRTATTDPLTVLHEFGGCEIAAMAGAAIGAASAARPVVVDGFIASAAALVAVRLVPSVREYCILAHRSAEPGHDVILSALGHPPLLDLGLRLGEGTGALLALPLLRAAARLLTDVASLEEVLAHAG